MQIYAVNIRHWYDVHAENIYGDVLHGVAYLSEDRRQKVERFLQKDDKVRSLAAGLLLRYVLGDIAISYGKYGKPYAENADFFSIAHSGDYVVLAVSAWPVGIDVEEIVPFDADMVHTCCTVEERTWLSQEKAQCFYKLWTAKESIMKATGRGFALNPADICVLPLCNGTTVSADESLWHLYWHSLPRHKLCLASAKPPLFSLSSPAPFLPPFAPPFPALTFLKYHHILSVLISRERGRNITETKS